MPKKSRYFISPPSAMSTRLSDYQLRMKQKERDEDGELRELNETKRYETYTRTVLKYCGPKRFSIRTLKKRMGHDLIEGWLIDALETLCAKGSLHKRWAGCYHEYSTRPFVEIRVTNTDNERHAWRAPICLR